VPPRMSGFSYAICARAYCRNTEGAGSYHAAGSAIWRPSVACGGATEKIFPDYMRGVPWSSTIRCGAAFLFGSVLITCAAALVRGGLGLSSESTIRSACFMRRRHRWWFWA